MSAGDSGLSISPFTEEFSLQVKNVALESWRYTYSGLISPERIESYVDENYSMDALRRIGEDVRRDETSFNLLFRYGRVAGFCQFGNVDNAFILLRIYLVPSLIGKGIGRLLLERGEKWVSGKGGKYYSLYVHKGNKTGITFYEKMKFIRIPDLDNPEEYCYRKHL